MNIGNGWSGTTADGRACIDIQLDGVFSKIFPWLKDLRFRMTYIAQEDRSSEKAPDWGISTYPKQENRRAEASTKTEELVKNANVSSSEVQNYDLSEAEIDRLAEIASEY